jgi:hypothetical protein
LSLRPYFGGKLAAAPFGTFATNFRRLPSSKICYWVRATELKKEIGLSGYPAAVPLLPTAGAPFDRNRSDPSNTLSDPLSLRARHREDTQKPPLNFRLPSEVPLDF